MGVTTEVTGQARRLASLLTELELRLLAYCHESRDRESIQAGVGLRNAEHLRRRYLRPLLDEGLLERTDPGSPNSPRQRYRTTALGAAVVRAAGAQ